MDNAENKLKGNYYIAWLSRCDSAWRRLLADRGPYVSQYQLKKEHHEACQTIAKDLLWSQFNDWKRGKKYGPKANPRRGAAMKRRRNAKRARPSPVQAWYQAARKQGEADELFMEFVREGLTREELAENIRRRPALWGRYAGFLNKLPSGKRNPRRRRRNRLHAQRQARRYKLAQRQARRYKLAQRRGRLGFLRRLKGRANPRRRSRSRRRR